MDERQKWHVAWARFTAFRNSMPSRWHPQAVEEFHGILSALEGASSDNDDLTDFRIPKEMMKLIPVRYVAQLSETPGQIPTQKRFIATLNNLAMSAALRGHEDTEPFPTPNTFLYAWFKPMNRTPCSFALM